jgi:predicted CxxxxCH...CXXCH cytochrome family protein
VSTSTASYQANTDLAAPGYIRTSPLGTGVNTNGQTGTISGGVSNDPKVGAHDAHLRGTGGFKTGGIVCTDCHTVTSLSSSGHMNGSTTFVWSALSSSKGLIPVYAGGACSNTYCHGNGMVAANRGTNTSPTWTSGTYLANPAANLTDCGVCHASPPAFQSNGVTAHAAVTLGAGACNACHGHTGSDLTHIDGILQATGGACSSCHDYDVDANGDWGKSPKAIEGWGAHAVHINHLKTLSGVTLNANGDVFGGANFNAICGVCHTRQSANHDMGGAVNTRTINFGDGQTAYLFSTASGTTSVYNGVTGVSSATTPKTCSNVSCHFQPAPFWQGI